MESVQKESKRHIVGMELFKCTELLCKLIIRADEAGELDHICLDCGWIYNADNHLDYDCDSYKSCPICSGEVGEYDVNTGESKSKYTPDDLYEDIHIDCPKCGGESRPYCPPS